MLQQTSGRFCDYYYVVVMLYNKANKGFVPGVATPFKIRMTGIRSYNLDEGWHFAAWQPPKYWYGLHKPGMVRL
jgi:hypothetical protein